MMKVKKVMAGKRVMEMKNRDDKRMYVKRKVRHDKSNLFKVAIVVAVIVIAAYFALKAY
jgi:hypothetical protein